MDDTKTGVLFVCLGNICRSPTAEGAFLALLNAKGKRDDFEVDSAGTSGHHDGESPDPRSAAVARAHGVDLSNQRSRRVTPKDFERFDYVLAMDEQNLRDLHAIAPANHDAHVALFLSFVEEERRREVPDPYYGGPSGFDDVFALCTRAAEGLLAHIESAQAS